MPPESAPRKGAQKSNKQSARIEPKWSPKWALKSTKILPCALLVSKMSPKCLQDHQNEPSGLQKEPPDLKNELLGSQKWKKIHHSDALTEDQFLRIAGRISCLLPPASSHMPAATCLLPLAICPLTQGLTAEAYAFRSAAARSCLRANAGVLGH